MRDAVIVLAHLMDAAGRLNDESLSRLSLACEFVRAGEAPVLVTCGWAYRNDTDICIADAMAQYAIRYFRIDRSKVVIEPHSRDTVGDAVFTKRNFVNSRAWNDVIIVTTAYHVNRTREIFSFIYGKNVDVAGAEGPNNASLEDSEKKSLDVFRATFKGVLAGDDAMIYRRLIISHPFYNGVVYPAMI